MSDVWVRWSGLSLLDDGAATVYTARLGETLSRVLTQARAPAPRSPQQNNAPRKNTKALTSSSQKVFSSQPSLRELMSQYNRSTPRSGLIKPGTSQHALQQSFSVDRVDFIDLPNIPGRILRPSN